MIAFPRIGIYTEIIQDFLKELDIDTLTLPITQKTIKLGVRNSPDMICYPFKVTLGYFIQALEEGVTDLLMFDTGGTLKILGQGKWPPCRFRHYHHIQKQILENLGYKFKMHTLNKNFLFTLKKLNKKNSYYKIMKNIFKCYKVMQKREKEWLLPNPDNKIKIGIVGEIFTVIEPSINYDIVNTLKKLGCNVDVSVTLSSFIKHLFFNFEHREERKEARHYLKDNISGHGFHSIYNSIYYAKNNFDAIIHIMPLSCMPETTVQPLLNMISDKYNIPIHPLPIDEDFFQTGHDMRIKSIIRVLERGKYK